MVVVIVGSNHTRNFFQFLLNVLSIPDGQKSLVFIFLSNYLNENYDSKSYQMVLNNCQRLGSYVFQSHSQCCGGDSRHVPLYHTLYILCVYRLMVNGMKYDRVCHLERKNVSFCFKRVITVIKSGKNLRPEFCDCLLANLPICFQLTNIFYHS